MALTFQSKPVATITARFTDEQKSINVEGCNAAETSIDNAAAQINKLLAIVGRSVRADSNMYKIKKEEAVDNG